MIHIRWFVHGSVHRTARAYILEYPPYARGGFPCPVVKVFFRCFHNHLHGLLSLFYPCSISILLYWSRDNAISYVWIESMSCDGLFIWLQEV